MLRLRGVLARMRLGRRRDKRSRLSGLTKRILAVNLVPLCVLLAGIFYLDRYEDGLLQGRLDGMGVEAQIISAALGVNAEIDPNTGRVTVDTNTTRVLVHRLVQNSGHQARIYGVEAGQLVADSRLIMSGGRVAVQPLPPPVPDNVIEAFLNWILQNTWGDAVELPPLLVNQAEPWQQRALIQAFQGYSVNRVRPGSGGIPELHVMAPIQHVKRVVGVLMLTSHGEDIRLDVAEQRIRFALVVLAVFTMTVALSLYLAGTIGRPVVQLAAAARRVKSGYNRREQIPNFGLRRDEIGELSIALKDMTQALYTRLDAIEAFAADVAHEVKTPLTSLRSAVETINLAKTREMRDCLLNVIKDDVDRLDRLITDISEASRVDAELSRAASEPVNIIDLVQTMVCISATRSGRQKNHAPVVFHLPDCQALWVEGVAGRLGQVLRNLIDNAISFTPPDKTIDLHVIQADAETITISVQDSGSGLPPGDVERLFERFYSDRADSFASEGHSGLGLSIVQQIVTAHRGTVTASNRLNQDGEVIGAQFDVRLPIHRIEPA